MDYRLNVSSDIIHKFPSYKALVLYVTGLQNQEGQEDAIHLLKETQEEARTKLTSQTLSTHPHIAAWRAAYSEFGSKPSKYLCSAESLLKRVLKGQDLPNINAIVDIYNAVSMKHVIPVGGENWEGLTSDLVLRFAEGNEPFVIQSNETITEFPDHGEVIWCDDQGVTCRRWNWRQCTRTAITLATTQAYFVFDGLYPYSEENLVLCAQDFISMLKMFSPSCEVEQVWLT